MMMIDEDYDDKDYDDDDYDGDNILREGNIWLQTIFTPLKTWLCVTSCSW